MQLPGGRRDWAVVNWRVRQRVCAFAIANAPYCILVSSCVYMCVCPGSCSAWRRRWLCARRLGRSRRGGVEGCHAGAWPSLPPPLRNRPCPLCREAPSTQSRTALPQPFSLPVVPDDWTQVIHCYVIGSRRRSLNIEYSLRSVISYVLPLEKYSEVIFVFALPAVFFALSEAASVGVPCALMLWTGHAR